MKKKSKTKLERLKKSFFVKIMKVYLVLFIIGLYSTLSAVNTYSQTASVTLKLSNAKLENLFSEIEKNSDYVILYKKGIVEDKTISVDAKNENVENLLNRVLPPLSLSCHINGKQIVVVKTSAPIVETAKEPEQDPTILASGVITDSSSEPLSGVTVVEKGKTTNGVMTDENGKFSFRVSPGATLQFSYIGFVKQEIAASTNLKITMKEDENTFEDVVVVGYGSARKVGTTIGSMQQVTAAKIQARPAANVLDALQGQVAGLQVYSNSGEPGTTQEVIMHGNGSLGASSTPLYIVDGIMVDAGSIVAMNPNDFESVTLLKDASATSIYGARAANGVMVITTKRGLRNSDAKITVRSQYGVSQLADRKFFNQLMSSEQLLDFWEKSGLNTQEQIDDIRNNPAFINPKTGTLYNTRWVDHVMRDNTPTSQTDLSIQGGNEKTVYFISGGYFDQQGTSYGSEYKRYTVRSNVESQVKNWLKLGLNMLLSYDNRKQGTDGSNVQGRGLTEYGWLPWITPIDPETGKYWESVIPGATMPALAYTAANDVTKRTNAQVIGNFFVEIAPFKGFKIISRSGTDMRYYLRDRQRVPSYNFGTSAGNGLRSIGNERTSIMTTNNVLEYKFDINQKHFITLLAGQEGISYKYTSDDQEGQGLTDDRLMEMYSGMSNTITTSGTSTYQFLSFFGRADYNYDDRFFADFSLRNDASSRFGRDNRNALFWSVGAMWNLKKESFMESAPIFTDARLKASYGTQGNAEIGNYAHQALTGSVGTYDGGTGWGMSSVGNSGLTWEQQSKLTLGLRAELASRYTIELDFYRRRATNMLMNVPYPLTTAFPNVLSNVGAYQNQGIDLNLGMTFVRGKDYHVGANVVFNYNTDKVLELYQGKEELQALNSYYVVGEPLMYYFPLHAGIDPEDGKQMWYVPGEDWRKTTKDKSNTTKTFNANELMQNTGKPFYQPVTGGFGVNGGWKGFTISADFSFMLGRYIWDNTSYWFVNGGNRFQEVADFWTPENRNAKYPSWKDGQSIQVDDFLLKNASFLRMKNLTVSYNFDKKLLEKTKVISSLRLFVTGRNLLTVTEFTGLDPEYNANGHAAYEVYPNSKQYEVGIEFVF